MKEKKEKFNGFCLAVVLISAFLFAPSASAQSSVFTYQGKLNDGGAPANGSYDLQFKLFDAGSAGNQIGATVTVTSIQATAGIFSAPLDFGAGAFSGADRFLEIAISLAGQNNFTTLAPRQKLNSAPYSIQAVNSGNSLNLGGIAANQYVLTNDTRLDANNYVQNTTVPQASVNFNIGGSGAANIFDAATQFNLGGNRILSNAGTDNLFVGNRAGIVNNINTGRRNTFVGNNAGQANQSGADNTFFGNQSGSSNIGGGSNAFFGGDSGQANTNGNFNAFFGKGAGQSNTSASQNSFFGNNAGVSNTTGNNNAFFGTGAGRNNISGSRNSSFGSFAGSGNDNTGSNFGSDNSFFGASAGSVTSTGFVNSFFGSGAGSRNTSGTGNSFFGALAGANNTTGNSNIFIGQNSGNPSTATQVSDSIAIGNNVTVPTSNTIVLGTTAQTTQIPGELTGTSGGIRTFTSGFSGMIVGNLLIRRLGANDVLPSPAHLCFRFVGLPFGDGGGGITTCTTSFSSVANKTDVQLFTGGLEIIKQLRPVSFKWKADGANDLGLNAEDVAAVAPSLISHSEKGEIEDVKESGLTVVLINAIKEQQKQIETQQTHIEEQRKTIERQQRQINALWQLVCATNPSVEICKEKQK